MTPADAAAYAELVTIMPDLDDDKHLLPGRARWQLSIVGLIVLDLAISCAGTTQICQRPGLTSALENLQTDIRLALAEAGLGQYR